MTEFGRRLARPDPHFDNEMDRGRVKEHLPSLWDFEGRTAADKPQDRTALFVAISYPSKTPAPNEPEGKKLLRLALLRISKEFQEQFGINQNYMLFNDPIFGKPKEEIPELVALFVREHARTQKTAWRRWQLGGVTDTSMMQKYPFD